MTDHIDPLGSAGVAGAAAPPEDPMPRVSGWRTMDSAPRDATEIIALCPNRAGCRGVLIVHFAQGGGEDQPRFGPDWFFWTGYSFMHLSPPPTHWMPIPLPPEPPQ